MKRFNPQGLAAYQMKETATRLIIIFVLKSHWYRPMQFHFQL